MWERHKIYFEKIDNKEYIYIKGVDFGDPLEVLAKADNKFLCRVKGRTGWFAVGVAKYYNPEYIVLKVNAENLIEKEREFQYDRKTMKKVFREAVECFARL